MTKTVNQQTNKINKEFAKKKNMIVKNHFENYRSHRLWGVQIKTTLRYDLNPVRMASFLSSPNLKQMLKNMWRNEIFTM